MSEARIYEVEAEERVAALAEPRIFYVEADPDRVLEVLTDSRVLEVT